MADIFISYSRKERPHADAIYAALSEEGFTVWYDKRLDHDDFGDVINREVTEATAVITLWSPLAVASKWVRGETQRAFDAGKLINVAIANGHGGVFDVPIPFNIRNTIDLSSWSGERNDEQFRKLVSAVRRLQGKDQAVGDSGATTPHTTPYLRRARKRNIWFALGVGAAGMAGAVVWLVSSSVNPPSDGRARELSNEPPALDLEIRRSTVNASASAETGATQASVAPPPVVAPSSPLPTVTPRPDVAPESPSLLSGGVRPPTEVTAPVVVPPVARETPSSPSQVSSTVEAASNSSSLAAATPKSDVPPPPQLRQESIQKITPIVPNSPPPPVVVRPSQQIQPTAADFNTPLEAFWRSSVPISVRGRIDIPDSAIAQSEQRRLQSIQIEFLKSRRFDHFDCSIRTESVRALDCDWKLADNGRIEISSPVENTPHMLRIIVSTREDGYPAEIWYGRVRLTASFTK